MQEVEAQEPVEAMEKDLYEEMTDQQVESLYILYMAKKDNPYPTGKDKRKAKRLFHRLKKKGYWCPKRGRSQLREAGALNGEE